MNKVNGEYLLGHEFSTLIQLRQYASTPTCGGGA